MVAPDADETHARSRAAGQPRPGTAADDGPCLVCGGVAEGYARWERATRRVEILPSQHSSGRARFPWGPAVAYDACQLVRTDSGTWDGEAAAERAVALVRCGWLPTWVFRVPGAAPLADRADRGFATHRRRLSCAGRCTLSSSSTDPSMRPAAGTRAPRPPRRAPASFGRSRG